VAGQDAQLPGALRRAREVALEHAAGYEGGGAGAERGATVQCVDDRWLLQCAIAALRQRRTAYAMAFWPRLAEGSPVSPLAAPLRAALAEVGCAPGSLPADHDGVPRWPAFCGRRVRRMVVWSPARSGILAEVRELRRKRLRSSSPSLHNGVLEPSEVGYSLL